MGFGREIAHEVIKGGILASAGKKIVKEIKKKEIKGIFCEDCGKKIKNKQVKGKCCRCGKILCGNCVKEKNGRLYCDAHYPRGILSYYKWFYSGR